jgi:hypothetical protein
MLIAAFSQKITLKIYMIDVIERSHFYEEIIGCTSMIVW